MSPFICLLTGILSAGVAALFSIFNARLIKHIRDALHNPFTGIGKPEPLRNNLKGWWSRRIRAEHRLIYRVAGESLLIMQCRFRYDD